MDKICDFHTHTSLSDGALSPIEVIRYALVNDHQAIALTDHASTGTLERIIREVSEVCKLARAHWGILAVPGIELTHVPPEAIAPLAQKAKEMGAWLVVVHGETIAEPVEKGTNLAALSSPQVDILSHPGLLTEEEARLAASRGVFLEISARKGHSLTNGHVAKLAQKAGAKLLLNSDAHTEQDILNPEKARAIALGAGLDEKTCQQVLFRNPQELLRRLPINVKA